MTHALENQSQDNLETHLAQVQTLLARMRLVEELVHRQGGPRQDLVENLVHMQNIKTRVIIYRYGVTRYS
jgi:magnesium transporter